ncbi:MAG: TonB-dependent receptor [Sulfurimonas sp.]|nr:TonB-dependent receptor [Sulfurimonas sp.]
MNKIIPLSLVAILSLSATEIELDTIGVESTVITEVAENAQVSADLAEALSAKIPSVTMNRRSGIANDVYIRGQKRDNISVEVDGTKTHGACPNRMDPPVSHILANQIDEVEVIEGPYDVTTFGTMSGGLKITTKKPTKEVKGEVTAGVGSWGYKKLGATISGGNDTVRVLVSASTEQSGQYEDGDGNDFAQQLKNYPAAGTATYQTKYEDMDAYEKKSVMAKAFVSVTDDQELRLSYTGNRSDNILYPNSKMDALYDDSNIYNIEYNIANINDVHKAINLQYYYSDVDHPMSTLYRNSGAVNYMTSHLKTSTQGLKLKNNFALDDYKIVVGLDGSLRTWDGDYYRNGTLHAVPKSINDAETKNAALFATMDKQFGNVAVKLGARYDMTDITNANAAQQDNSYNALNANIFTTYTIDTQNKVFIGIGQASRVPDARELYFVSSMGSTVGTPNLDQTTNREIDLGYEFSNDLTKVKVKTFYSDLEDYIYIKQGVATNAFSNIDAKIYGAEISSETFVSDDVTLEASLAYKRGKKDQALAGQTDTNLADIAPLQARLGATYEYAKNSAVSAELLASDAWDTYDSDNGEQKLAGWATLNLKAKHAFGKTLELTVGVNNLFDTTYATSNTYTDLTLLLGGTEQVMLLNDPGRYLYTNLTYKF